MFNFVLKTFIHYFLLNEYNVNLSEKSPTFTVVPQVKDLSVCNVILICSNKTQNTHLGWECTKRYITLF